MKKDISKDYIEGYKDAVRLVQMTTEKVMEEVLGKQLSTKDLFAIVDRYISLTHILGFSVEQFQTLYDDTPEPFCDEDCESCEMAVGQMKWIEEMFKITEDIKEEL